MVNFNLVFPVYVLNSDNIWEQDGIVFIDEKVLDDLNQTGDTIGRRRLQTPLKGLFPLKFQIDTMVGLIKHRGKNYIDSTGKYYYYEKTTFTKLVCHKIMNVEDNEKSSTIWLKDINFSFTEKRPPKSTESWAQVLYLNGLPWLIYNFLEQKQKETRRKI
jgi:hypothetical protein|tara:strand:+ start:3049 stop:3528 length:480 start_codon:yes stop_codon:yes gene_type:complete